MIPAQMQTLDLTKLSVEKLKALGFDEQQKLFQVQQNIQAIQIELNRRFSGGSLPPKPEPPEPKKPKKK